MPNDTDDKETTMLAVVLAEASAKIRTGPPKDEESDLELPIWAGVLPLGLSAGDPQPDDHKLVCVLVPPYLSGYRRDRAAT